MTLGSHCTHCTLEAAPTALNVSNEALPSHSHVLSLPLHPNRVRVRRQLSVVQHIPCQETLGQSTSLNPALQSVSRVPCGTCYMDKDKVKDMDMDHGSTQVTYKKVYTHKVYCKSVWHTESVAETSVGILIFYLHRDAYTTPSKSHTHTQGMAPKGQSHAR